MSEHTSFSTFGLKEWIILSVLIIANVVGQMAFTCISPFFANVAIGKGLSLTMAGIVFAIFNLCGFLLSPFVGRLIPIFGAKNVYSTGMILMSIGTLVFAATNLIDSGTWFLIFSLILRTLQSMGYAMVFTSYYAIAAKDFPKLMSTIIGLTQTGAGMGCTIGPVVGGYLYQYLGYSSPFLILGSFAAITTVVAFFSFSSHSNDEIKEASDKVINKTERHLTLIEIIKIKDIWCIIYTLLIVGIVFSFHDSTLAIGCRPFHLTSGEVGLLFLGLGGMYSLFSPICGHIIDKYTHINDYLFISGYVLTTCSFIFMGPLPFFSYEPSVPLYAICLSMAGLACSILYIPAFKQCMDIVVKEHGFADSTQTSAVISGLYFSAFFLGACLGPLVGSAMVEYFGYSESISIIAGFCFASMKLILYITFLLNLIYHVEGTCNTYYDYYLLGVLTKKNSQVLQCQNMYDKCILVSLNAPGLVVGTFAGCSTDIMLTLTEIVNKRLDVKDQFLQFFNNQSNSIDTQRFCDKVQNEYKVYNESILTGTLTYYANCYYQGFPYDYPLLNVTVPTKNANLVACPDSSSSNTRLCTEGYCGMLEYTDVSSSIKGQFYNSFRSCPVDVINGIYFVIKSNDMRWNQKLIKSLPGAAEYCVNKTNHYLFINENDLPFCWYVNCYDPSNGVIPMFPAMPDWSQYTSPSTTTNSITTTNQTILATSQNIIQTTMSFEASTQGELMNSPTNLLSCKNVNDTCSYASFNIPALAIGTISGCSSDVGHGLYDIVTKRSDIKKVFSKFLTNNTYTIDMFIYCKSFEGTDTIYTESTITGNMAFYGDCITQGKTFNTPLVNYTAPTATAKPTTCSTGNGNETIICSEGYCGMFEYINYSPVTLTQINGTYQNCPNTIINDIYRVMSDQEMYKNIVFLKSLLQASIVCGKERNQFVISPNDYSSFYWFVNCYIPQPGELTTNLSNLSKCENENDKCVYISLNAPGLGVGTFSGCASDVGITLTSIVNKRLDVKNVFYKFFNNDTKTIDMQTFCYKVAGSKKVFIENILTGNMTYYADCYTQGSAFDAPLANYSTPTSNATPNICFDIISNQMITCKEGYCAMFQFTGTSPSTQGQYYGAYRSCPNTVYNQMYLLMTSQSFVWNIKLRESLSQPALACSNLKTLDVLSIDNYNSYYWYIDCYISLNGITPTFPTIPDLSYYISTTTESSTTMKISTTTKGCDNSFKIGLFPLLLILLSFLLF
uniref:MFS domain-containing protein n=1 Tax=Parastrongyloides trichosuri TaxID=131310 RepID=A0A0N4ZAN8_PARTI